MSMGSSGVFSVNQGGLSMVQYILILLTIMLQVRKEIGDTTGGNATILPCTVSN